MTRAIPGEYPLYFVTDHARNAGRPKLEVIAAALCGGVKLVQYRDKALDDDDFEAEAGAALELCRKHGATLLINDRVHIAKRIGADGVHLGQGDMAPEEARRLLGPDAMIGLSTHDGKEVLAAKGFSVNYINIGPIFPTSTKDHVTALGTNEVLRLAGLWTRPWTTMGGIKLHHLSDLFRSGVKTVAMVTEISLADDVERRTSAILAAVLKESPPGRGNSISAYPQIA
jgi:thiamine-phosphate pyrophosphorylase